MGGDGWVVMAGRGLKQSKLRDGDGQEDAWVEDAWVVMGWV